LIKDVASRPDAEYLDQLLAEAAGERSRTILSVPKSPAADARPERAVDTGELAAGAGETIGRLEGDTVDAGGAKAGTGAGSRTGRGRRWVLVPVTLAALTAGLVFRGDLLSFGEDRSPAHHNSPPPSSTSPTASPTVRENLRTPAGARRVVRELKKVMGTTRVMNFDLEVPRASAQVPSKDGKVWDYFDYKEGKGEKRSGYRSDGRASFDIAKVNWDALPRLMRTAETGLGLKKASVSGVHVGLKSAEVDRDDEVVVLEIVAVDEYGGARLYADADGKIIMRDKAS
ncbi:serine/threonine protein kinase, partial [Streptomyces sp. NPDC058045]